MTKVTNIQFPNRKDGHKLDRTLLEYLKPKPEGRYSKLEAYCDLLNRSANGGYMATTAERQQPLVPGQFVASISELARKWQWQRATVRQFIEGLVALKQLFYVPFSKNFIFTLNPQQQLAISVSSEDDILDFCRLLFARFIQGRESVHEVAESYERYYDTKMEQTIELENEDTASRWIVENQTKMFNQLASSISDSLIPSTSLPNQLSDSVLLLFGRDLVWNWHRVIDSLGLLTESLRAKIKPSMVDHRPSSWNLGELHLLDSIYEHYLFLADNKAKAITLTPPDGSLMASADTKTTTLAVDRAGDSRALTDENPPKDKTLDLSSAYEGDF